MLQAGDGGHETWTTTWASGRAVAAAAPRYPGSTVETRRPVAERMNIWSVPAVKMPSHGLQADRASAELAETPH